MTQRLHRPGFMAVGKVEVSLMKDTAKLNHETLTVLTREKQKEDFRGFLLVAGKCQISLKLQQTKLYSSYVVE